MNTNGAILLIQNATVVTMGGKPPMGPSACVLHHHSVVIQGERVSEIVPAGSEVESAWIKKASTVINGSGKLVLSSMINAHMHFYSSFARGLNQFNPSQSFTEVLNHLWWRLDRKLTIEDSYYSALVASIEAIKHGTTLLIDHHASPFALRGSLASIAKATREACVRASLCYEVSDRDGEAIAQQGIDENLEFIESCRNSDDGYIKALFGLHASFTLSDKTLNKIADATKNIQTGFHIHVAEDLSDQKDSISKYGMRVVQRLEKFGFLGPNTICAHGVHLDDVELEILKKTDTIVVHNPQSNMNNAVGAADLLKFKEKGILLGLGSDAMTTNMMEELRAAIWLQSHYHQKPTTAFMEAAEALIIGNRKIARRYWGSEFGGLFPGSNADLAIYDYDSATELNGDNFFGHLVFGISQAVVDTTICNGRVLMQSKKILHLDEPAIMKEARSISKKLWERF